MYKLNETDFQLVIDDVIKAMVKAGVSKEQQAAVISNLSSHRDLVQFGAFAVEAIKSFIKK